MAFSLDRVVPWGRSFAEYQRMFALSPEDLQGRILGCGDGPASFNAESTKRNIEVVSVDPLYEFRAEQIRARIKEVCPQVLEQTRQNREGFVWNEFRSIEALGWMRLRTMVRFLKDFPAGREAERYLVAELPQLPFGAGAFDLALCSHLLFLYSDHLSEQFHLEAVAELCRVADEVRIFPLLTLATKRSPYIDAIVHAAERSGRKARIERVPYEFQRGGNEMLRISKAPSPQPSPKGRGGRTDF